MNPAISIILPAYNEEKYIKDTLISLKNQDFDKPYEVIVCDNNSKDNTVKIAKKYADKVVFEKKQGGGYARNKGASVAKGKYFIFGDVDTIYPTNYLKEAYKIFLEDKYVAFTGGFKYLSFKNKTFASEIGRIICEQALRVLLLSNKIIPAFNFCISKKWFEKSGGFFGEFPEDYPTSQKLRKFGKIKFFRHFPVYCSIRRYEGVSLKQSLKDGIVLTLIVIKLALGYKHTFKYTQPWQKKKK